MVACDFHSKKRPLGVFAAYPALRTTILRGYKYIRCRFTAALAKELKNENKPESGHQLISEPLNQAQSVVFE